LLTLKKEDSKPALLKQEKKSEYQLEFFAVLLLLAAPKVFFSLFNLLFLETKAS